MQEDDAKSEFCAWGGAFISLHARLSSRLRKNVCLSVSRSSPEQESWSNSCEEGGHTYGFVFCAASEDCWPPCWLPAWLSRMRRIQEWKVDSFLVGWWAESICAELREDQNWNKKGEEGWQSNKMNSILGRAPQDLLTMQFWECVFSRDRGLVQLLGSFPAGKAL